MKTKVELLREADRLGASFLANVIFTGCGHPAKKLAGLVELLNAGHQVSTQQFEMFKLCIDGRNGYDIAILETPELVPVTCLCGAPMQDGVCSVRECVCSKVTR